MIDIYGFAAAVGIGFLSACAFVGAYIWLRWGVCGIQCLWSHRELLDIRVEAEVEETTRTKGGRF